MLLQRSSFSLPFPMTFHTFRASNPEFFFAFPSPVFWDNTHSKLPWLRQEFFFFSAFPACMDRATFARSTAFFRDSGNSSPASAALPGGQVDFIAKAESFTYSDFFRDYLLPNHPCVFSAKFTEDWSSRRTWVTCHGKPNFEHLLREFGEAVVPVANCDLKEYNSNPKEQLPFKEFVEYWREYIGSGYRSSRGCLYLKDWHLSRAFPELDVYSTPVYFSSDWLNEYWDAVAVDDYRFVYMGPKGSW
ncbi:2-oxoglutarate and iron-dependent oxygenase JMJD4 isoform X2 [Corvus kubaryi]|uniref:2-oxoglutarate and iron-dependent oxygenase JMJD4 isoform X2 n=1 Tax=Corvus kubaryi TaxID=68294 RepID=UPI001C05ADC5|nr:2-oxoglutarate and iron-dependent oxygenase JMJD4 isoform X2 [Corvus kubaryi]